ncbi:uncharacterized protein Hap1MRO34_006529 [Clarias gariepinus]
MIFFHCFKVSFVTQTIHRTFIHKTSGDVPWCLAPDVDSGSLVIVIGHYAVEGWTRKVFGSGTRLYVTDPGKDQVKEPQVSVYPVSRQSNGKSVLLCQAKGMFPDLVRFKWKTIDQDGRTMDLNTEERLEQRDKEPEVRITSMLIVDQQKAMNNKFICSVQHTNNAKEQELVISKESKPGLFISCPPPKAEEMEEEEFMDSGLFNPSPSLYLFSMTYIVLLLKNLLYFCTVFVLLCKRNPANMNLIRGKAL